MCALKGHRAANSAASLHDALLQQIRQMNHADGRARLVDDGQHRHGARLVLLHDGERRRRQLVGADRQRLGEHDLMHRLVEEGVVLRERAADDAVRQKPDELARRVDDGNGAKPLLRHDEERILRRLRAFDDGILLARVHDILHLEQEAPAERTARMEEREILLLEVPHGHHGDGDRIAHRQRRRRARRRRKPQGAGLRLVPDVDDVIRVLGELRGAIARHGDDRRTDTVDDGQNLHDLLHLAAVRNRQDDILIRHHAEVAMKSLRRMHEERRRARTRKRRGNLATDMPRLSHARDDDARLAVEDALNRAAELLVNILRQLLHRRRFHRKRLNRLFSYHISLHSLRSFSCSLVNRL